MSNEPIEITDIDPTHDLSAEEMESIAGGKGALGAVVAAASAATVFASFQHIEKSMLDMAGGSDSHGMTAVQKLDKMTSEIYGTDDQDGSEMGSTTQVAAPAQANDANQPQISMGGGGGMVDQGGFVRKGAGSEQPYQQGVSGGTKAAGAESAVSIE